MTDKFAQPKQIVLEELNAETQAPSSHTQPPSQPPTASSHAAPSAATTSTCATRVRKRKFMKKRAEVWSHFTEEKDPVTHETTATCNYCGQICKMLKVHQALLKYQYMLRKRKKKKKKKIDCQMILKFCCKSRRCCCCWCCSCCKLVLMLMLCC